MPQKSILLSCHVAFFVFKILYCVLENTTASYRVQEIFTKLSFYPCYLSLSDEGVFLLFSQ